MTNLRPLLTEPVSFRVNACQIILLSCLDIQHTLLTIFASVLSGCSSSASIIKNSTCRCMDTLFKTGLSSINSGFTSPLLQSFKIVYYHILIPPLSI